MSQHDDRKNVRDDSDLRWVDAIADQFDAAWQAALHGAPPPRIEDYVRETDEARRPALLRELIQLDVEYRHGRGNCPTADDYLSRFESLDAEWSRRVIAAVIATSQPLSLPAESGRGEGAAEGESPISAGLLQARTKRIRCPHCQSPIQLVDDRHDDVLCPSCGSSFRLRDTRQTSTIAHMRQLGKFQLLERLGIGAFGAVWKARDTVLDKVIALKIPHAGSLQAEDDRQRFFREARAAAQLRHPGIVTVHEVAELESDSGIIPSLVYDFVEGLTLRELLNTRRLTFRESAELIAQLAEALDYAHSMRVVHRDMKPANVMIEYPVGLGLGAPLDEDSTTQGSGVREQGSEARGQKSVVRDQPHFDRSPLATDHSIRLARPRPLILDFGLALRDEAEATMTVDGQILGTPAYMSPEQATGHSHQVDGTSDIYSIGVMLYELLTGGLPFRGSRAALVRQIVYDEPLPPRRVNDKISRDLETISLKCLAKSPAGRYATARALADDLRRWLRGEPIQARPVTSTERLWRWCHRNPATASLTGAVGVLLTLIAVGSSISAFRIAAERDRAEESARKERNARAETNQAKELAETKGEEHLRQLVRQYIANGVRSFESDDLNGALLWFAEILKIDQSDASRRLEHRMRYASVLRQCQRPVRLFFHDGAVKTAAFSNDGTLLATASEDGSVQLHETLPGRPVGPSLQHEGAVNHLTFSNDGRYLATASQDGKARVWNTKTLELIIATAPHKGGVNWVAFNSDATKLATASWDRTARVWDAHSGKPVTPPIQHANYVWRVLFSPNGKHLLTHTSDAVTRVWDSETGLPISQWMRHDSEVTSAAFSPDGRRVATVTKGRLLQIWNAESGQLLGSVPHLTGLKWVSYSDDGKRLITITDDWTAHIWDAISGKEIHTAVKDLSWIRSSALTPDARFSVAWNTAGAQMSDRAALQPADKVLKHDGPVNWAGFSPDGKRVVTASADGTARVWDTATARALTAGLKHDNGVRHAVFSLDGMLLASACYDGRITIWNSQTGSIVARSPWNPVSSSRIAFNRDGTLVAAANADGTVRFWHTETGEQQSKVLTHKAAVHHVEFSPTNDFVATASTDQTAVVWDVTTGLQVSRLLGHSGDVWCVSFSRDGKWLVTASSDGTARVGEVATGMSMCICRHFGRVNFANFDPSGQRIVTTSSDSSARVWDATDGTAISPPLQHREAVTFASFSPDSRWVVTASVDGTARVWNAVTGELIAGPLSHYHTRGQQLAVNLATFSPDGRQILTASVDGTARLWDLTPDEQPVDDLVAIAQSISMRTVRSHADLGPADQKQLQAAWETVRHKYVGSYSSPANADISWRIRMLDLSEARGEWLPALFHVQQALKARPTDASLWHRHAQVALRLDLVDRTIESEQRAVELNRDLHEAYDGLAKAHQKFGRLTEAVAGFSKAIALAPDEPLYWYSRATVYEELKDYDKAIRDYFTAIELNPGYVDAWNKVNGAYKAEGRFADRLSLYTQLLDRVKAKCGPNHPDTLTAMHNLASAYDTAARRSEALALYEQTLSQRKEKLGPDHPNTLSTMCLLGIVHQESGRLLEAISEYEQGMKLAVARFGPDHEQSLSFLSLLAMAYGDTDRLAEALPLYERHWTLTKAKLGTDHPETLSSLDMLAGAYRQAGRLPEALAHSMETLRLRKSKLGPDHADTLKSFDHLALGYRMVGRPTDALPLYEEALKLRETKLGESHPDTIKNMTDLAKTNKSSGRLEEAVRLYETTLALRKATLGPEHTETLLNINGLTDAYHEAGRVSDALYMIQELLRILGSKVAANPDDSETKRNLATAYSSLGDIHQELESVTEAKDAYSKALVLDKTLVAAYPEGKKDQTRLSLTYSKLATLEFEDAQYQAAGAHYREAVHLFEQLDDVGKLSQQLRGLISKMREAIGLCEAAERAVDSLEFALAQGPERGAELLCIRASVLARRGRLTDAATTAQKLLELTPEDPDNLYNVACCYALCVAGVAKEKKELSTAEESERRHYADRAIAILHESIVAGFKDVVQMQKDRDLTAIREHPVYKELVERLKIVDGLFGKGLLKEEVIRAITEDKMIPEPVRIRAIELAQSRVEDANALNNASRPAVSMPDQPIEQYRLALRRVETAHRIDPDNVSYLNTLGAAQYRVGQYEAAMKSLTRSDELNTKQLGQSHPVDVAFLAMVQHKLGHKDQARALLDRLRENMEQPQFSKDDEAKALLKEAEDQIDRTQE